MTACASYATWKSVTTPVTRPDRVVSRSTRSCLSVSPGWFSRTSFMLALYCHLSHCVRTLCTARPFDVLSSLICVSARSAFRPISPPSASTSRTTCALPGPPMAGLHGIHAMLSSDPVSTRTRSPARAAARAASHPACPAPTTMQSYCPPVRTTSSSMLISWSPWLCQLIIA